MSRFVSGPDGEWRECRSCARKGYGVDAWHPATREFWPVVNRRIWFGRCLACCSEMSSRKRGVVEA